MFTTHTTLHRHGNDSHPSSRTTKTFSPFLLLCHAQPKLLNENLTKSAPGNSCVGLNVYSASKMATPLFV